MGQNRSRDHSMTLQPSSCATIKPKTKAGLDRSKEELLHQLVSTGNVDAIKALGREGVDLEWVNEEGKTPLVVASMDSGLINVAKTLIEIGANDNAYRRGRHAGTPLHHAAERGLEHTVLLLLSSGGNALITNDDHNTALDIARTKGHTNVVRAIENHVGYFTGWLWVVVSPCGSSSIDPIKPVLLELAIYSSLQDCQPRTQSWIPLFYSTLEEPKFRRPNPTLTVTDSLTKTRHKFASSKDGDKEQLRRFYDACRGISQLITTLRPHFPISNNNNNSQQKLSSWQCLSPPRCSPHQILIITQTAGKFPQTPKPTMGGAHPPRHQRHPSQDAAIRAKMQRSSTRQNGAFNGRGPPATSSTQPQPRWSQWSATQQNEAFNGWGPPATLTSSPSEPRCSQWLATQQKSAYNGSINTKMAPSAPPVPEEDFDEGPISYHSIEGQNEGVGDSSPATADDRVASSSCVICWEAPIEGACVPCGHMAGCMACLNVIEKKNGACPVCRAKMKQVIRIYAV